MMKKILLIATGGTLASQKGGSGLAPGISGSDLLSRLGSLIEGFTVEEEQVFMMDSSNIQPEEWSELAALVFQRRRDYDGIVITHGTDTLAYTANALSFSLQNIEIPVVLTGSQVSIENPIADAMENCRAALHMAASGQPGVFIAFNRKIILGTRGCKVRTHSFDAFESINYPYAARINSSGLVINPAVLREPSGICQLQNRFCSNVYLLKLYPGISPDICDYLVEKGYQGVYIEAFGIGGIPFVRRNMVEKLGEIIRKGIIVVVGSQCLYEESDFSLYEVGQKALEMGVIETGNMTSESAMTKLMWALGQFEDKRDVYRVMNTNLVGEMCKADVWNR